MVRLWTTGEVANALSVSRSTVARLVKDGLPVVRMGRLVRFDPEKIEAYIDRRDSDRAAHF